MSSTLPPSQIILAEDSLADVGLVRHALREHNVRCDLRVISDGQEVMAFIDRLDADAELPCPDLLLLDLSLPKHDGREILQHLRASRRCGQTPVVVMTSSDWAGDRQAAEKNAAIHYFRKPSSLAEFMRLGDIVRAVLSNTQPGAPHSTGNEDPRLNPL